MARSGRLAEIERELGEPASVFLPRVVKDAGSILQAAIALGITPNTIHHWKKEHHYKLVDGELVRMDRADADHS